MSRLKRKERACFQSARELNSASTELGVVGYLGRSVARGRAVTSIRLESKPKQYNKNVTSLQSLTYHSRHHG